MKKSLLILAAAALCGSHASAQVAAIYASGLNLQSVEDGYQLSFELNENATDVTIEFLDGADVAGTYSLGAQTKGIHSVTIPMSGIPYGESMSWQVKATGAALSSNPVRISDDTGVFSFFRPFGVAVDNNPQSDFFGRIYVSNAAEGNVSKRGATTAKGIFVLGPQLNDVTNQGNAAYTGGVCPSGSSTNIPYRVAVAPDGRVFLCGYSDAYSGIYIMDPANPSGSFTTLFAGLTRASSGLSTNSAGVAVHGSSSACRVLGEGENTVLYTADEDFVVNGVTGNHILQYNIGTKTSWNEAPVVLYDRGVLKYLVNSNINIAPDGRGGWWISQNRSAETSTEPGFIHFNGTEVDFTSYDDDSGVGMVGNSGNSGLGVSPDGSRLATTGPSKIYIWDVTFDENGVPSLTKAHEITGSSFGLGANSNDLSFDWAGNVYYVSNSSERLSVIALPKAENSAVTPGKVNQTVTREFNAEVSDLQAVLEGNDVVLSWTATADDVLYKVYRDSELLDSTDETTYTDKDLESGNTYVYGVSAAAGKYESDQASTSVTIKATAVEDLMVASKVYPNPTDGLIYIELPEVIESVRIYDVNGRLVLSLDNVGDTQATIDLSDCAKGNYVLKVNSLTYRIIRK